MESVAAFDSYDVAFQVLIERIHANSTAHTHFETD